MEVEIDPNKSAYENLSDHYDKLKKLRKKIRRIEEEIENTEKEIKKIRSADSSTLFGNAKGSTETCRGPVHKPSLSPNLKLAEIAVRFKKEPKKKWYHSFRWFITPAGRLVVGGRNAGQNDELFAKHMNEKDLFFHADVPGGSVVILKDGAEASYEEKMMAAVFAGVYSRAWKQGAVSVDVYDVRKEQVSKHADGGTVGRGAFAIEGQREWFRNTKLEVYLVPFERSPSKLIPVPSLYTDERPNDQVLSVYPLAELFCVKLVPGTQPSDQIAKKVCDLIKKRLNIRVNPGDIEYLIPGSSEMVAIG